MFVTSRELKVQIYLLNGAIYRLKQSPLAQFNKLIIILLSFGFRRCNPFFVISFRRCNSSCSLFVFNKETSIVALDVYGDVIKSSW